MDLLHRKDTTAASALYTLVIVAIGATGLLLWRAALGQDGGILRLLRHLF